MPCYTSAIFNAILFSISLTRIFPLLKKVDSSRKSSFLLAFSFKPFEISGNAHF